MPARFDGLPLITYERQKKTCLKPHDIRAEADYVLHIKLKEIFRAAGGNAYALSSLVRVSFVDENERFIVMKQLDFPNGEPIDPTYSPSITPEGILIGTTNIFLPTKEGYFASEYDKPEKPYQEADERLMVPTMASLGGLALAGR
jgi:hypothetical protein